MRIPSGKLLPLTIGVLAALLGVKTASLGYFLITATAAAATPSLAPNGGEPTKNVPGAAGATTSQTPPVVATKTAAIAATSGPDASHDPSLGDALLLADLQQEREELARREASLSAREAAAAAASEKIDHRMTELDALQQRITSLEAVHRSRNEAAWSGLVRVYEAMRPADAANIFNALELRTLLALLDRMNDRKAALILASMQPERARLATQMLAQQRQEEDPDPPQNASSSGQQG